MYIRFGYDITITCSQETTVLTRMSLRSDQHHYLAEPEIFKNSNAFKSKAFKDVFSNNCVCFIASPGDVRLHGSGLIKIDGLAEPVVPQATESPINILPDDIHQFLLPSRYCESDLLSDFAWSRFGGIIPGWARVQAICDYVHNQISFSYGRADASRTAAQALRDRTGVCRDYAHAAVALCRAMSIPARYVNGYLGDIGVPYGGPMDFSAWFEAYLDDRWFAFDARHNFPRIGRIPLAIGRDAADVPMIQTFGHHDLKYFNVFCEEETSRVAAE